MSAKSYLSAITCELVSKWRKEFYNCAKTQLAQNVCVGNDPIKVCLLRTKPDTEAVASVIELDGKAPGKQQEICGWICTGLNLIRLPIVKALKLADDFEFSQAHIFYWHKIERCNYFLYTILELLVNKEPINSRKFSYLMKHPVPDGGQWHSLVNLIEKYGLMPKQCYVVSYSATKKLHLNAILRSKLRENACKLHAMMSEKVDMDNILCELKEMLYEIYKVITICLGDPPGKFTWEYYNKKKIYNTVGPITSLEFYDEHVKPHFNIDSKVCIGTDPRETSYYNQNYMVQYNSNMIGGHTYSYQNQSIDSIIEIVMNSLNAGVPVWCACDAQSRFNAKPDECDLTTHDFKLAYDVDFQKVLPKPERMLYRDSVKNKALILTGAYVNSKCEPLKFRANSVQKLIQTEKETENKKKKKPKKEITISIDWFREFVYEIVVDKKFLPEEIFRCMQGESPEVLPVWDPMGAELN